MGLPSQGWKVEEPLGALSWGHLWEEAQSGTVDLTSLSHRLKVLHEFPSVPGSVAGTERGKSPRKQERW